MQGHILYIALPADDANGILTDVVFRFDGQRKDQRAVLHRFKTCRTADKMRLCLERQPQYLGVLPGAVDKGMALLTRMGFPFRQTVFAHAGMRSFISNCTASGLPT